MMVRHPFTRLVSAYEDKMLNPKPLLDYHKTVQNEIKSRRMRLKLKTRNFTFPSYLLETEKFQLMLKRKITTMEELQSQPSFEEFVSWLLETRANKSGSPESWTVEKSFSPFFSICPVCQVDYKVIKLDGFMNEIDSWISHLNLPITSAEAHTVGGGQSSSERSFDYFSQLTKNQVLALYNIYQMDFQLFSYSAESFINAATGPANVSKIKELVKTSECNNIPFLDLGKLLQKYKLGETGTINNEASNKNSNEKRKSLQFLERAKMNQLSQIRNFNKQFGLF